LKLWQKAIEEDNIQYYREYIEKFPEGQYVKEANDWQNEEVDLHGGENVEKDYSSDWFIRLNSTVKCDYKTGQLYMELVTVNSREKEIGPNAFFLFYGPDFVDHLLRNGWLLKVISVRWDTEYGSGIFNMHIVRGSVSSFIRKHILDHLDELGRLHIRIDKQRAYLGELALADSNVIKFVFQLEAYPATREKFEEVARELVCMTTSE
jgi:hypothetical protein